MTRIAGVLVVVGILGVAVGVALYDFRAGVITGFALVGALGIWHLTTQE